MVCGSVQVAVPQQLWFWSPTLSNCQPHSLVCTRAWLLLGTSLAHSTSSFCWFDYSTCSPPCFTVLLFFCCSSAAVAHNSPPMLLASLSNYTLHSYYSTCSQSGSRMRLFMGERYLYGKLQHQLFLCLYKFSVGQSEITKSLLKTIITIPP